MASTYGSLLRTELMADGEKSNTWGQITNVQHVLHEEAIAGFESVDVSGGVDVTLTSLSGASDQARNAILKFTGTISANINVIIPSSSKVYIVWNATSGAFTVTVKTSGGAGVVIPQGEKAFIFCDGTDTYEALSNMKKSGKETIPLLAAALTPSPTNGCAPVTTTEITSGKPPVIGLAYDKDNAEYAEIFIPFSKSWNEGTLTARIFWSANDASANGVAWTIEAVAISDNDAVDSAYGTAVTIVDNNQNSANRMLASAESSAITIAGSPAEGDIIAIRIGRNPANGSDNLAADAVLIAAHIYLTTNAANDA